MLSSRYEENENIRVTSSCWLNKQKNYEIIKKKKISWNNRNERIYTDFNICTTSIISPILKLKNDLECISENKKINRQRENRYIYEEQELLNINNDDEITSMLYRSKAFNETWLHINNYMNCFIYNYLSNIIDKEINFLNTNLCLKDDKISLLILKTQTCPFSNLLQYKIICDKLKLLNNCSKNKTRGRSIQEQEDNMYDSNKNNDSNSNNNINYTYNNLDDHPFYHKNNYGEFYKYTMLKKEKKIISCIINVYSNDSVENIIMRIIKKVNSNFFLKVDRNNMNELFHQMCCQKKRKKKKKKSVLIIFIKDYLKLKSSIFSAFLLYLMHLKEIYLLNISVIITNNCILSGLNNLDYFIKKNMYVNIFNLYISYSTLIQNMIFNPIFNNVLFKLKEYYIIINNLLLLNNSINFLKIKYFFYMFIKDFYDKKILSFLNIPLSYFLLQDQNKDDIIMEYKKNKKKKQKKINKTYKQNFNIFKKNIIDSYNMLNINELYKTFLILFCSSNFFEKHINYLKIKNSYHYRYIMHIIDSYKKEKNNIFLVERDTLCHGKYKEHMDNIKIKQKKRDTNKYNNKRKNIYFDPSCTDYKTLKKSKKSQETERKYVEEENDNYVNNNNNNNKLKNDNNKNLPFYNCIKDFYINHINNNNNSLHLNNINDHDNVINNISNISPKHHQNKIIQDEAFSISTSQLLILTNDNIKKKLKNDENYKNYYFQKYAAFNLTESLTPINKLLHKDFEDDCNTLKQYIINNLSRHMAQDHHINPLNVLKIEWRNNEFLLIYKYERMIKMFKEFMSYKKMVDTKNNHKKKKNHTNSKNNKHDSYHNNNSNDKNKKNCLKEKEENVCEENNLNQLEDNDDDEEMHNTKKSIFLYYYKLLIKSISLKMIKFIYRKNKYNICINIINIILKNIPTYSSLRKRIKLMSEMFKKYEQKYFIHNYDDLKQANDDIEKEIKQTLNTLCDILINLYINKMDVLKKILNDIYIFIKDMSYINKLENYIYMQEKNNKKCKRKKKKKKKKYMYRLNMPLFINKLKLLNDYLNYKINLNNTNHITNKSPSMDIIYQENNIGINHKIRYFKNESNVIQDNIKNNISSYYKHNSSCCTTPKKSNDSKENISYEEDKIVENIQDHQNGTNNIFKQISLDNKVTDKIIKKKNDNDEYGEINVDVNKKINDIEKMVHNNNNNLLSHDDIFNNDLIFIEYLLVFVCEYIYFLVLPSIFLFPLCNEFIAHEHTTDFFDILNVNIQNKLLNVLHYNKLQLNDINNVNNVNNMNSINNTRMGIKTNECVKSLNHKHLNNKPKLNNKECHTLNKDIIDTDNNHEMYRTFQDMLNKSKMEDLLIIFKLIENCNTKYINVCSMFVEYINIKYNASNKYMDDQNYNEDNKCIKDKKIKNGSNNLNDRNKNKGTNHYIIKNEINNEGESFQELFYKFIIALLSLFYFIKLIHIPSSFLKGKEDPEDSFNENQEHNNVNIYFDQENNTYNDDINEKYFPQEIIHSKNLKKSKDVEDISTNKGEIEMLLSNNIEKSLPQKYHDNTNLTNDLTYKKYILDILSNINIKKLIFGKAYM
ncbi:hypothetical protein PFBG_02454 [Plasmodium falciparum 7G8]|uniref:Uncharacterized protein n=1 Tax=Plasmodium falciparum (isolate 7G8) TaxID=57266 RepID=W7F856_PLAF8|nr:hypothetical protein PFBG_02454 [Plasmodium falciparum 7G8]